MFILETFKPAMNDEARLFKPIDTEIGLLAHCSHPDIGSSHHLLHDRDSQQSVINLPVPTTIIVFYASQ